MAATKDNSGRADESMANLALAQATLVQALADMARTQATLVQNQAAFVAEMAQFRRDAAERYARMESMLMDLRRILGDHGGILVGHGHVLQRWTDAVRERTGFAPVSKGIEPETLDSNPSHGMDDESADTVNMRFCPKCRIAFVADDDQHAACAVCGMTSTTLLPSEELFETMLSEDDTPPPNTVAG